MNKGLSWMAALAVAVLVVAAAMASESVFVVDEREGQVFDLADLNDGEVRVFGAGEDRITATRDGDEVRLEREPAGAEGGLMLTCEVDTDLCQVITHGDSEHVMIRVERSRTTKTGEGHLDREIDVNVMAFGAGSGQAQHIVVTKEIACDGSGSECAGRTIDLMVDEVGGNVVMIGGDDLGKGENKFIIRGHGMDLLHADEMQVVLRCPRGDTTMLIDPDEADEVYMCPKHNEALERSGGHGRRIWVEKHEEH